MQCCEDTADAGMWFPYLNDCLEASGFATGWSDPGEPGGRFGPPNNSTVLDQIVTPLGVAITDIIHWLQGTASGWTTPDPYNPNYPFSGGD